MHNLKHTDRHNTRQQRFNDHLRECAEGRKTHRFLRRDTRTRSIGGQSKTRRDKAIAAEKLDRATSVLDEAFAQTDEDTQAAQAKRQKANQRLDDLE